MSNPIATDSAHLRTIIKKGTSTVTYYAQIGLFSEKRVSQATAQALLENAISANVWRPTNGPTHLRTTIALTIPRQAI